MTPLNKKLWRDLWHMKGQAVAIAMVIAGGVAALVMSLGTRQSLEETRQAYYEQYRFADVFAEAKRAPESLMREISAIPGVVRAEARIVEDIILDVANMEEPVRGRVISTAVDGHQNLNDVVIRAGRNLRPGHPDEILIHEAFAEAHGLLPGGVIHGNINGKRRSLEIAGIALSPEFVYAIGPGEIVPDDRRFAVIWMDREALEAAYDLKSAFNSVTAVLTHDAEEADAIAALDRLLDRYGGTGAIGRADQLSDAFLTSEMEQLANLTRIMPPIFLSVAAFLLNIVMARVVQTEREQIGLLKAFGYGNREIARHYLKMVMAITVLGIVVGSLAGAWMGQGLTRLYTDFFRFPFLYYHAEPGVFAVGAAVSIAAAVLGSMAAVKRAAVLAPAVAMVPPPPTAYRVNWIERIGLARGMTPAARMVWRHIFRWPVRALLTVQGIAFSAAILISTMFFIGASEEMMELFFFDTERQDMSFTFTDIRSGSVRMNIDDLPGVLATETFRAVPARLIHGHRRERVAIKGLEPDADLSRLLDVERRAVALPPEGIVLSDKLAKLLDAREGDFVTVAALEGRRPVRDVPVSLVVRQYVGLSAYMDRRALNRLMGEGDVVSGANVLIDANAEPALYAELKETPALLGLGVRRAAYETFRDMIDEHLYTMIFFYVAFAAVIAVGVVYNSARISLSERARELASLRVLGFTRREAGLILVGESAALTLAALPLGCALGYGLAALMVTLFDTKLYRIPLIVTPETYGFAVLVVLAATAGAAWVVIRRVNRLDLVAVLKTRE